MEVGPEEGKACWPSAVHVHSWGSGVFRQVAGGQQRPHGRRGSSSGGLPMWPKDGRAQWPGSLTPGLLQRGRALDVSAHAVSSEAKRGLPSR